MNTERLNILADFLDTNPPTFRMHEIDTCIAGQAMHLFAPDVVPFTSSEAADVLGLAVYQSDHLFFPFPFNCPSYDDITAPMAATAVRTFIATNGQQSWAP